MNPEVGDLGKLWQQMFDAVPDLILILAPGREYSG